MVQTHMKNTNPKLGEKKKKKTKKKLVAHQKVQQNLLKQANTRVALPQVMARLSIGTAKHHLTPRWG